jgi:ParB family chromosome partitioning protein
LRTSSNGRTYFGKSKEEKEPTETNTWRNMEIALIPIKDIHLDEDFNCRGRFSKVDVVDLAKDIEAKTSILPETQGLIQPVTVREYDPEQQKATGYQYGLVAGFRRLFACKVLNRTHVAALIKKHINDVQAAMMNLSENLKRRDLNMLQEANAISKLKRMGVTMDTASKELGVSRSWVQVRYSLLELEPEIQQEAAAGIISQYHVKQLYALPRGEPRFAAVRKIKDAKLRGENTSYLEVKKVDKVNLKKVRNKVQIQQAINFIARTPIGFGIWTRALAWASGEIDDKEFHESLEEVAKQLKVDYHIPLNFTFE